MKADKNVVQSLLRVRQPYPKPKQTGGTLIREVVQFLRLLEFDLPIDSHIHCGLSSGPDSLALVTILVKYGRRILQPGRLHLVHINHQWRKEADADEQVARDFSQRWGVPIEVVRLERHVTTKPGESWEDLARRERNRVFSSILKKDPKSLLFTAHHADDLAETLLWRLFTGASKTHGGGILAREARVVRPLLRVRKAQLQSFLDEEGIIPQTDHTNQDPRFLRARMRQGLIPAIESVFPQAVQHLVDVGLEAQGLGKKSSARGYDLGSVFFSIVSRRVRRAHWEALESLRHQTQGRLDLPEGWVLKKLGRDHWILER